MPSTMHAAPHSSAPASGSLCSDPPCGPACDHRGMVTVPPAPGAERPDVNALHEWMLSLQSQDTFYRRLQAVYARAAQDTGWGWEVLYENPYLRCGLLWFSPGGAIPLHDHEDMLGVLIGLIGEIEVERYDAPAVIGGREGHVLLEGGLRTIVRHGDVSVIDGPRGNVHGLRNTGPRPAIALDALWHGDRQVDRHLFFPTGGRQRERLSAFKLRECRVKTLGQGMPLAGPSRVVPTPH